MKNLISQGTALKLIRLEDNDKYIVYIHQNKRRNFENPEEKGYAVAEGAKYVWTTTGLKDA